MLKAEGFPRQMTRAEFLEETRSQRSKRRIAASRDLYEAAQEYCRAFEGLEHEDVEHGGGAYQTLISLTDRVHDKAARALKFIGDAEVDNSRRTCGYNPGRPRHPGHTVADHGPWRAT